MRPRCDSPRALERVDQPVALAGVGGPGRGGHMYGQTGDFEISVNGHADPYRAGRTIRGLLALLRRTNFSAHVVDKHKPFISETAYRSFMGNRADMPASMTVDKFCEAIIDAHMRSECKGRLKRIEEV